MANIRLTKHKEAQRAAKQLVDLASNLHTKNPNISLIFNSFVSSCGGSIIDMSWLITTNILEDLSKQDIFTAEQIHIINNLERVFTSFLIYNEVNEIEPMLSYEHRIKAYDNYTGKIVEQPEGTPDDK